jgi:hypothetical protein
VKTAHARSDQDEDEQHPHAHSHEEPPEGLFHSALLPRDFLMVNPKVFDGGVRKKPAVKSITSSWHAKIAADFPGCEFCDFCMTRN